MGMTPIMLNMPRKVVHEYSTPMMFCTVPTEPPASPHAVNNKCKACICDIAEHTLILLRV